MNNETLKIDLCSRLPYGLKFKYIDPYDHEDDKIGVLTSINIGSNEHHDEYGDVYYLLVSKTTKPILFSSLTESITINGETFVPIEKICEMRFPERNWKWEDHVSGCGFRIWIEDEEEDSEFWFWMEEWWDLPVWLVDLLNQWHINYRLGKDQFIPATNEYA